MSVVTNDKWIIAIEHSSLALFGFEQKLKRPSNHLLDQVKKASQDIFVGWDDMKVVEGDEGKNLYTKDLSSCIGVIVIAKVEDKTIARGLCHAFMGAFTVRDMLQDLVIKIDNASKKIFESGGNSSVNMEVFITGGMNSQRASTSKKQEIDRVFDDFKTAHPEINLIIKDDTFSNADIGEAYISGENGKCYKHSIGIAEIGFDEEGHPYQIIGLNQNYPEVNYDKKPESILWTPTQHGSFAW